MTPTLITGVAASAEGKTLGIGNSDTVPASKVRRFNPLTCNWTLFDIHFRLFRQHRP
jgi:hypothetical protein